MAGESRSFHFGVCVMAIVQGKACKRCGCTDRYFPKGQCISCHRAKAAIRKANNLDAHKAIKARYKNSHRTKLRRANAERRRLNPEAHNEETRGYMRRRKNAKRMGASLLAFSNMIEATK